MKIDISTLLISIHTSIVVLCLFSMIYLGSIDWKKNKWLLLAFLGWGWSLLHLLIGPDGYGITPPSSFLQNPASALLFFLGLYLYTFDLIGIKRSSYGTALIHFIPFLVFYFLFSVIGFPTREEMYHNDFGWLFRVFILSLFITGAFYGYLILHLVKLNHKKYKDEYADVNPFITLDWVKWMIWITLIFFSLGTIALLVFPVITDFPAIGFAFIAMLLVCATLSYFSFRQPILYQEATDIEKDPNRTNETSVRTLLPDPNFKRNIRISENEKKNLITQIEQYMLEYEPFLNPKIRMPELAKTLKIPRYIFSYLINEHYQMNFFQFINQYRIEHVKKLLAQKENQFYTLETISQMSGFNSKSTFNIRFKEVVGKSPKEYQQKNRS